MPYKDPEKQKLARHESYIRNKDKVYATALARRAERKAIFLEAKGHPCLDCNIQYPTQVMDFHHRDGATKDRAYENMIQIVWNGTIPRLLSEIEKCDLLCSNCHRIRHIKDEDRYSSG